MLFVLNIINILFIFTISIIRVTYLSNLRHILYPNDSLEANCYVDADFAGLWGVEYDQDPICVKSWNGYLITYKFCPLHWASKLQLQCLNQSKYMKDEKKMLICDACKTSKAIKNIHISLMHFEEILTFSLQGRQPSVI